MVVISVFLFAGVVFFAPLAVLFVHSEVSFWHSVCVAHSSARLAKIMGHGRVYCVYTFINGLFHDIGKLGISKDILHKASRLTDEEFAIIKSHSTNAIARLYGVFLPACIGHHKDFLGTGYGAEKVQSHVSSIVEICDVHNAVSGYFRTYRNISSMNVVIEEMTKSKNKFDPEIFNCFVKNIEVLEIPAFVKSVDYKLRVNN